MSNIQNKKQPYLKIANIRRFENIQSIKEDIEKGIFLILDVSTLIQKDVEEFTELVEELKHFANENNSNIRSFGDSIILVASPDILFWEPSYDISAINHKSLSKYPDFKNSIPPKSIGIHQTLVKVTTVIRFDEIYDEFKKTIQNNRILILNVTSLKFNSSSFEELLDALKKESNGFIVKDLEMFHDDVLIIIPPKIKLWQSDNGVSPYSVKQYVATSEKTNMTSPLIILKTRLAKGEISLEEFNKLKSVVKE